MNSTYTPAQRAALSRRYTAAEDLERARQIAREAARYGLATNRHANAIALAEHEYDLHTAIAGQAVNGR
jgi:hypothetical protein